MPFKKNNPGCGCCGECSCEASRDDFSHASIAVSGGAAAINDLQSANDRSDNCFGASDPVSEFDLPAIANASAAISSAACQTQVISYQQVESNGDDFAWGGSISSFGSGCQIQAALSGSGRVQLSGVVTYACVDSIYDYGLTVSAYYEIVNPAAIVTGDHPSWTWTTTATSYRGEKTVGGVDHVFIMELLSGSIWSIELRAGVSSPTLTVTLTTPPYDPFGLLVGTATITP